MPIIRRVYISALAVVAAAVTMGISGHADSKTVQVSIQGLKFQPMEIAITKGTTVVWTNNDNTAHTTTSFGWKKGKSIPGQWNSGPLNPGQSYRRRFTRPGSHGYYCMVHPYMTGVVTVKK